MDMNQVVQTIEAILFAIGDAVEISDIASSLGISEEEVKEGGKILSEKYVNTQSGIRLIEIADCYQLSSNPACYEHIKKVSQIKKQSGLSSAAIETLSIIAYNQPVTKGTVEFIRGVDSTYSVNKLIERGLIDELGRAETPGRPILYGTTLEFLRTFGLKTLEDLPPLPEKGAEETASSEEEAN
ncbi:MAG: SMC-Scp complex subunit ScpB [Clostridia bacterium]